MTVPCSESPAAASGMRHGCIGPRVQDSSSPSHLQANCLPWLPERRTHGASSRCLRLTSRRIFLLVHLDFLLVHLDMSPVCSRPPSARTAGASSRHHETAPASGML